MAEIHPIVVAPGASASRDEAAIRPETCIFPQLMLESSQQPSRRRNLKVSPMPPPPRLNMTHIGRYPWYTPVRIEHMCESESDEREFTKEVNGPYVP